MIVNKCLARTRLVRRQHSHLVEQTLLLPHPARHRRVRLLLLELLPLLVLNKLPQPAELRLSPLEVLLPLQVLLQHSAQSPRRPLEPQRAVLPQHLEPNRRQRALALKRLEQRLGLELSPRRLALGLLLPGQPPRSVPIQRVRVVPPRRFPSAPSPLPPLLVQHPPSPSVEPSLPLVQLPASEPSRPVLPQHSVLSQPQLRLVPPPPAVRVPSHSEVPSPPPPLGRPPALAPGRPLVQSRPDQRSAALAPNQPARSVRRPPNPPRCP